MFYHWVTHLAVSYSVFYQGKHVFLSSSSSPSPFYYDRCNMPSHHIWKYVVQVTKELVSWRPKIIDVIHGMNWKQDRRCKSTFKQDMKGWMKLQYSSIHVAFISTIQRNINGFRYFSNVNLNYPRYTEYH